MTYIRLAANDQKLAVAVGPKLTSGDRNSVYLRLVFSGHWNGYEKSAVFFTSWDKTVYEVILTDNECIVPHEVLTLSGDLYIGVRGVNPDTQAVKTSTLVKYKVEKGAPVGDATSVEPTPDVYQQILAKLSEIKEPEKIQVYVNEYLEKHPPKPGKDGLPGEPGKDGKNGYTPVKGVDYFDGYTPIKGVDYFDGKDGKDGQDYVLTDDDMEEIAEKAAEKIEIPEFSGSGVDITAKPGQLIRVQSVDENGKPTAWEPVPWGWVEGGMVEVLAECQPNFDESAGAYFLPDNTPAMEAGNTYFVNWNGTEYVCTSQEINGIAALGDIYTLSDGQIGTAPTGEPFCMMYMDGLWGLMPVDGSTELTISISQKAEIPHPIPGKLLPEGVPYVEQGGMVEIFPESQMHYVEDDVITVTENVPTLIVGETYIVNWNGTEYTCVGQDAGALWPGAVGLGDLSQVGLSGNGEPFLLAVAENNGVNMMIVRPADGAIDITLSIKIGSVTAHQIDPRCLFDGVPYCSADGSAIRKLDPRCMPDNATSVFCVHFNTEFVDNAWKLTTETTYEEIQEMVKNDKNVVYAIANFGDTKIVYSLCGFKEHGVNFSCVHMDSGSVFVSYISVRSGEIVYRTKTL